MSKRHVVNVMRPPEGTEGTRGEAEGAPTILIKNWPCSITPTGGSESDLSGGTYADRGYVVSGRGDPKRPIAENDYLMFGERRLDISSVLDVGMNGEELELTCSERINA